ncbi:MAG: P-II family nitrogen regulator [Acidobacteria bacterium]|nr:P-II family nitrogen regulator [Acidobacteriota bacterium]MCB9398004.1 P-II family nitrogen regulator [Acidobacteriota bacterium]
MKLVVAYIRPDRLTAVKKALFERQIYKISVTNAIGCGQQRGYHEHYRGSDLEVDLLKKVRIEIGVNDAFLDATIGALIEGGQTGEVGDGIIFVQDLIDCLNIRTGERGPAAIG